jgi:choline dehydrogenase-like flavoprotein
MQSPHLLNLSGIGNADDLRKHGIAVEADVSGVGGNLRNHVSVSLQYPRRQAGTVQRGLRLDCLSRSALEWAISGTGLLASPANAAMGFVRTSQSGGAPDIQMLVLTTSPAARPYLPLGPAYEDSFILGAVLLRPKSTGKVFLRSTNPEDVPAVQLNILSSDSDRNVLSEGVRLIDEIGRQAPLASFIAAGRGARPNISERSQSDAFVMANATPMYHPSGTCRMGTSRDPLAVVDPEFRVRGIGGLRVVDASVMPDLIGGNPVACVTMLAEKASDLIRGRVTGS